YRTPVAWLAPLLLASPRGYRGAERGPGQGGRRMDGSAQAVIEFRDVAVDFGRERIYDGLTFSVRNGEFLCILGPSGCGKSTSLRVMGDLLDVSMGAVAVDGRAPKDAW